MGILYYVVPPVLLIGLLLGPIVFLLWVWRRTGSWVSIARGALLVVPVASFVLGGGVLALVTAFRVFILGTGTTGPQIGMSNWQYVGTTFFACGIYAVAFSGTGLLLSLPFLALWYRVQRQMRLLAPKHVQPDAQPDSAL